LTKHKQFAIISSMNDIDNGSETRTLSDLIPDPDPTEAWSFGDHTELGYIIDENRTRQASIEIAVDSSVNPGTDKKRRLRLVINNSDPK